MDYEQVNIPKIIVTVLAAILLVLLGVLGVRLVLNRNADKPAAKEAAILPDFTNQTKDDVLAWGQEYGIEEKQFEFTYIYDEEADKDIVLSQNIPAETELKDEVLILTLSEGPNPDTMFTLPDFRGLNKDQIDEWFKDHKFTNIVYEGEGENGGTFVSIIPASGMVKRTDQITVKLNPTGSSAATNTGKDVTVPDFSSSTRMDVLNWGKQNNVNIKFFEEATKTTPKDRLIRQSPASGSTINHGDTVTVTFCSGLPVTLANFVGKPQADAKSWCETNKLNPVFVEVYGVQGKGLVEYQAPGSGIVPETAQINFGVSIGKPGVKDFTEKSLDEALAFLSELNGSYAGSANISYEIKTLEDARPVNTIIRQSLKGTCDPGSKVVFTVSGGVTVPDLSGLTEEVFIAKLENLNVSPGTKYEEYSDTVPMGTVIWNETGAKNRGDKVAYTVSIGPASYENWTPPAEETPAPESEGSEEESGEGGEG